MRKEFTNGNARVAVLLEFPRTCKHISNVIELSRLYFEVVARIFAVVFVEQWFRIKRVDLGGTAVHI